mmetsp:Transcript_1700/g.3331  ORF Transcript_1700/g.3331 Transcript_1700/m.3331 type:complete len:222 (+) Transcript_1700:753-1418(+)
MARGLMMPQIQRFRGCQQVSHLWGNFSTSFLARYFFVRVSNSASLALPSGSLSSGAVQPSVMWVHQPWKAHHCFRLPWGLSLALGRRRDVSRSTILSSVDRGGGVGARGWIFFVLNVRFGKGWVAAALSTQMSCWAGNSLGRPSLSAPSWLKSVASLALALPCTSLMTTFDVQLVPTSLVLSPMFKGNILPSGCQGIEGVRGGMGVPQAPPYTHPIPLQTK